MINGKSVLAIIPARGGSKGVPRKNVKILAGKPLISWTIEEAKKSKYIDRLILSSDDEEIIRVAKRWGCEVPFVRPKELAQDDTPGIEPVLHALSELTGYKFVLLLQPTSPFRTVEDIDVAIEACLKNNADTCVSVSKVEKSPYWMYEVDEYKVMKPLLNPEQIYNSRQLLPTIYSLNGAIYLSSCDWLRKDKRFINDKTFPYIMPVNRSIDIDSELDFIVAECLMLTQMNKLTG